MTWRARADIWRLLLPLQAERQDAQEQHQSNSAPGTMKNYTKDRSGGEDTEERKDRGNAGQNPVSKD